MQSQSRYGVWIRCINVCMKWYSTRQSDQKQTMKYGLLVMDFVNTLDKHSDDYRTQPPPARNLDTDSVVSTERLRGRGVGSHLWFWKYSRRKTRPSHTESGCLKDQKVQFSDYPLCCAASQAAKVLSFWYLFELGWLVEVLSFLSPSEFLNFDLRWFVNIVLLICSSKLLI